MSHRSDDGTTLDRDTITDSSDESEIEHAWALVLLGVASEPSRAGEVLLFVGSGPWTLGRAHAGDHLSNFLKPYQQRPGGTVQMPGILDRRLSRSAAHFARTKGTIEVRSSGKMPIFKNGVEVESATLQAGDTLRIGKQLLGQFVRRPLRLAPISGWSDLHPFGRPDRFGIVGESPAAWTLRRGIGFVGPRAQHVLIHGETGVGKELTARGVHGLSARWRRAFVARNAATVPEQIADAEFFGNAKNYPNPGMAERDGLIGAASGGTLFIDEVAELPETIQTKLLRVMDPDGSYQRLGETRTRVPDVRVIMATNRALDHLRPELRARVPLRVDVPGLRDRTEDIPLIARALLQRIFDGDEQLRSDFRAITRSDDEVPVTMSLSFVEQLVSRPNPLNVRAIEAQLWASISESLASGRKRLGAPKNVPVVEPSLDVETPRPLTDFERQRQEVLVALGSSEGNRDAAAEKLELASRHVLYRLMKNSRSAPATSKTLSTPIERASRRSASGEHVL